MNQPVRVNSVGGGNNLSFDSNGNVNSDREDSQPQNTVDNSSSKPAPYRTNTKSTAEGSGGVDQKLEPQAQD
jgi:hypothetical protein